MFNLILTYFKKIDKILLFLSIICSLYGLHLIHSATASYGSEKFVDIQLFAIILGLFCFIIASLIDLDYFASTWKFIFVVNILLQCSLFLFGVGGDTTGNNSWIRFGEIGIQPGEIGKILFIYTFSVHTALLRERMNHIKNLTKLLIHAGLTSLVVMITSSDMGMVLAYLVITAIILFIGGLSLKWFYAAGIAVLAVVPIVWNFVLKEYQKVRILIIFDPTLDPDRAYQGLQSQTAIGAGGFNGSGYLEGSLTQFGGLPAKHTDFIFSVAAEEYGFIGSIAIIALLSLLIVRIFFVCFLAPTDISSLVCAGIAGMFLFQSVQNILMCLVIAPVIGLTLPFFSYGGTSVVTMFIAIGIASGVKIRDEHIRVS